MLGKGVSHTQHMAMWQQHEQKGKLAQPLPGGNKETKRKPATL